jgi:uncharacterized membrane protein (GlpM family)
MNKVSLIIAFIGVLASGAALLFLKSKEPRHYWLLGLAALFPGWLVAFLAVIDPASQSRVEVPLPPRALLSSAAGLVGVIATDYFIRRAQARGGELHPLTCWIGGVIALLPSWLIVAMGQ